MARAETTALDLPSDDRIRRILLIKWSAMGDVVMASAAFDDVVRAFPGREVDLNVLPPWHRLFEGDPRFRRVLAHDLRGAERGVKGMLAWLRDVRAGRYDLIVDFQSVDHTRAFIALLLLTGGAPRYRVGYHDLFPWNISRPVAADPPSAIDYLHAALAAAGIPARAREPILHVPDPVRRETHALVEELGLHGAAFAILLPGSQAAGRIKRWGADNYASLARLLLSRGMDSVLLIGGPDELDECAAIAAAGGERVVNLCGRTGIPHIVPLCEAATLIVANDTGTGHVAAAACRPVLVICGPTDPRRVRPLGDNVRTLQADLPCINCYRKSCPHHTCMSMLTPRRVLGELEDWLPSTAQRESGGG